MSYILDALKRSEQERHQGELTHATIDTIMLKAKPVKHQWWPYLLIAVLVLNLGVYLYFQFSKDTNNNELESGNGLVKNETEKAVTDSSINQKSASVKHPAMDVLENNTESQMVKPLPTHVLQTPKSNKYYDLNQVSAGSEDKRLNSNNNTALSVANNSSKALAKREFNADGFEVIRPKQVLAPAQKITPDIAQNKQSVSDVKVLNNAKVKEITQINTISSVNDIPENYELIEPTRDIPIASQIPVQTAESKPVAIQTDRFESLQHLSDLAPEFQKSIPDIRFNSHIFSNIPSERRVMINDLYLKEGQGFSGLKIVTIGEFYIELEKQGQSFKLPVLRDWFRPN